jgi:Ca2+-binding EF-hand superfamily protein
LQSVLRAQTEPGALGEEDIREIVVNVIDEADVDGDGRISLIEFRQVVARSPDFSQTFTLSLQE